MKLATHLACTLMVGAALSCGGDKTTNLAAAPGEPCEASASECVSEQLARVCASDATWIALACGAGASCKDGACAGEPGAQPGALCTAGEASCGASSIVKLCDDEGSAWVFAACGTGERCEAGECTGGTTPPGSDGGTDTPAAVCDEGTRGCASTRIARLCADDESAWLLVACASDERCEQGECVLPPAEAECTAGDTRCATDGVLRTCDDEGDSWVLSQCGDTQKCSGGACELDVDGAPCEPGTGICLSDAIGLRCLPAGSGYEQVSCPNGTSCDGGRCEGPACVIGDERCSEGSQAGVERCVDGTQLEAESCPDGQVCTLDHRGTIDQANCVAAVCEPGELRCGDPDDPGASLTQTYSRCIQQPAGTRIWVAGSCLAPDSCDPMLAQAGMLPCTRECTPGAERCTEDGLGFETCGVDATWAARASCTAQGQDAALCRPAFAASPSTVPSVECVDPACAALWDREVFDGGVCEGGLLRACGDDGQLAAVATACSGGACRSLGGTVSNALLGRCTTDCVAGETRCSGGAGLYRSCDDGLWSAGTTACPSSGACHDAVDAEGQRVALCGEACLEGERRCDASGGGAQTCNDSGAWAPAVPCARGRCAAFEGDALCVLECIPSASLCLGNARLASDGRHIGTDAEGTCTASGLLPPPSACSGTQACRRAQGGPTGCIECVGPNVAGGNEGGGVDDRCAGASVERCGAADTWLAPAACPISQTCTYVSEQLCDGCPNESVATCAAAPSDAGTAGCGDGVIGAGESCEPSLPLGTTCQGLGYSGGVLGCDPQTCTYDTSLCTMPGGTGGTGG